MNTDRFKFRVWDERNKRYFIGTPCHNSDGEITVLRPLFDWHIIEQCTGIKDKNNKLIYEGDVVRVFVVVKGIKFDKTYNVEFSEITGCFGINDSNVPLYTYRDSLEIIGNIHDDE